MMNSEHLLTEHLQMTYQQSALEEAMASSGQRGGSYSNHFNAKASAASPLVVEV